MWATAASIACISLVLTCGLSPVPLKAARSTATTAEMRAAEYQVDLAMNNPPPTRYEIAIEVGTPAQSFTAIIDTTTPYTTLVSSSCADCVAPDLFNTGESSTFKKETNLKIGNLTGVLGRDTVTLDADESITVTNQAVFVLSKDNSKVFDGQGGALGLGSGTPDHPSFVESLKAQKVIDRAIFALYAPHKRPREGTKYPLIWFGGWDTEQFPDESAFTFAPANTTGGKWGFDLTQASFGSLSFPDAKAVIDTSESKLIVPKAVYDKIAAIICPLLYCEGDPHAISVYDDVHDSLENTFLKFTLGDVKFSLSVADLIFRSVRKNLRDLRFLQIDWKAGVKEWRLGHGFLMNNYTLFDFDAGRVGFADRWDPVFGFWSKYWFYVLIGVMVLGFLIASGVQALMKKEEQKPEEEPLLPQGAQQPANPSAPPSNP